MSHQTSFVAIQLDNKLWAAGAQRIKKEAHVNKEVALTPFTI